MQKINNFAKEKYLKIDKQNQTPTNNDYVEKYKPYLAYQVLQNKE